MQDHTQQGQDILYMIFGIMFIALTHMYHLHGGTKYGCYS